MSEPPDGFSYFPRFLSHSEQFALLARLESLQYGHDIYRGQRLKRGYVQFGYRYVTAGRKLVPAPPLPLFLRQIIKKARSSCPESRSLNQCIVTQYLARAGINWHTDAPQFGDCVMAVSLGADAKLMFRRIGMFKTCYQRVVTSGSLYIMNRPARRDYQHKVSPVETTRYSLTFRYVEDPGAPTRL